MLISKNKMIVVALHYIVLHCAPLYVYVAKLALVAKYHNFYSGIVLRCVLIHVTTQQFWSLGKSPQ